MSSSNNSTSSEAENPQKPSPVFYMGQVLTLKEFDDTAVAYANQMKYEIRRELTNYTASNPEYNNTYYKYVCCRAGKPPKKKPKDQQLRPNRTSLKCDCGWYVRASHPMKEDKTGRDESVVKIVGLCLEHTNGCTGSNELMNRAIQRRRGRNYSEVAITHLRKEVKAGRYSTRDVKGWLVEQGMQDITLEEATNLRYRLLKDLPIKGWDFNDEDKEKMGEIQDFLFNEDLAMEIKAGAQKSVDNLMLVHCGLKQQVEGYDYRVCCDSENRFTGTCWQTGRMRNRLRKNGRLIFLDDSRSGINTSGFCFWNIVVIDHDGKPQTVMGAMTMTASNEAVKWILESMVDMCPEAVDIVKVTMSDLGVTEEPIESVLLNVEYCGACTWHIMTIDFPRNLGHLPDYTAIKSFVYDKLVHNTTSKYDWEVHLATASKKWPGAANYLKELSRSKKRWGAPWRLEHLTLGYKSSSPVEGSFSAFQRAIGDSPKSFVGVVQEHVKKDREKIVYEERAIIASGIRGHDDDIKKSRSDAGNQCAIVFSEYITGRFESTNHEAQNYMHHEVTLTSEQTAKGVTKAHNVFRRTASDIENPPPPRIVEEINGVKFCSCLEDVNKGEPCRHIQCVLGGAFVEQQFSCHWKVPKDVPSDDKAAPLNDLQNHSDHAEDGNDTVIENTPSVLPIESSIPASSSLSTADAVPQSSGTSIPAPSSQASVSTRHFTTIAKKKKNMDSSQKYNAIMGVAKQIANVVSQEDYGTFNKILTVMKWILSNIQNKGSEEMIAAAADYIGIQRGPTDVTLGTLYNGGDIQAPLLKRTAGATSTNRKRNSVEIAVTTKKVKTTTCKFCFEAHTIKQCTAVPKFGVRLTKSSWSNMIHSVPKLGEEFSSPDLDPEVPADAMMLQLVGSKETKGSTCYQANVILKGMKQKDAPAIFVSRAVIEQWSKSGASASHYVIVPRRESFVFGHDTSNSEHDCHSASL